MLPPRPAAIRSGSSERGDAIGESTNAIGSIFGNSLRTADNAGGLLGASPVRNVDRENTASPEMIARTNLD